MPKGKKEKTVMVRCPESAWATLEETLRLDAQAKNFEAPLRTEIGNALASLEVSPMACVRMANWEEMVQLVGRLTLNYDIPKISIRSLPEEAQPDQYEIMVPVEYQRELDEGADENRAALAHTRHMDAPDAHLEAEYEDRISGSGFDE